MPKKNSIINNTPPQEKILIDDEEPQTQPELTKPKRQISDAQREQMIFKSIRKKSTNERRNIKSKTGTNIRKKRIS